MRLGVRSGLKRLNHVQHLTKLHVQASIIEISSTISHQLEQLLNAKEMTPPGPPPRRREDWDVLGFPNRNIAVNGPPAVRVLPPRGRGGLPPRGMMRGRGRGGPVGPGEGFLPPPIPTGPRWMTNGNHAPLPAAGPSFYYQPSHPHHVTKYVFFFEVGAEILAENL